MKKLLIPLIAILLAAGCTPAPTPAQVENEIEYTLKAMISENNKPDSFIRLDDYFIIEQTDPLTYGGNLKATLFYERKKWDQENFEFVNATDSFTIFRKIVVKFDSKKYNRYAVYIEDVED